MCERWLPFTDEFFIPVKSKTNARGCTYGHVCRRCKSKVDAACKSAKRNKKRKEKEKLNRERNLDSWKGREGEYLIRGVPLREREEFLVKLYELAGLNFYKEMRKWKQHLIRTGKYEDVVMKYGSPEQKRAYLREKEANCDRTLKKEQK